MTDSLTNVLRQIRPLYDRMRDLDVVELLITEVGAVRVRRQSTRQVERITVELDAIARLSDALDAASEQPAGGDTLVVEEGPLRWLKITSPVSKEGMTIIALRVRPPRVTTSELVREGFISRRAIRQIENTLKDLRGVIIAGPARSGKTRLMTSLLGRLRTTDGSIIVLEDHIDLDTEGLEVTSLRRRLLPKADPERAVFEHLIRRADIIVADGVATASDWAWLYPEGAAPQPDQGRLLAMNASSEQEVVAQLLKLSRLSPLSDKDALDALGLDLLVLCQRESDGLMSVSHVGPLNLHGVAEAGEASNVRTPTTQLKRGRGAAQKKGGSPRRITSESRRPPDTIREDASLDASFDAPLEDDAPFEEAPTAKPVKPPPLPPAEPVGPPPIPPIHIKPTQRLSPPPPPPSTKAPSKRDSRNDDELGKTGELEDPLARLQRRLGRQNQPQRAVDPQPATPEPAAAAAASSIDSGESEALDALFLPSDLSGDDASGPQKRLGRSHREPTQPAVPIQDPHESAEAQESAKPLPRPAITSGKDSPSNRSHLGLSAMPSPSSRSSANLPTIRAGGLGRKRRKLPGALERKKSSAPKEEEATGRTADAASSKSSDGGARFSRAGRAFTAARVLDRPSKGKEGGSRGSAVSLAAIETPAETPDPVAEAEKSRAAAWAARRKAYTGAQASNPSVPKYDDDQDEATLMRDSRRLATPPEERLSELDEEVLFEDGETQNNAYDSESTSRMSHEVLSRGMAPHHHTGDHDKTLPRPRRKKKKN